MATQILSVFSSIPVDVNDFSNFFFRPNVVNSPTKTSKTKFHFSPNGFIFCAIQLLQANKTFEEFVEVYYDTKDWKLARENKWLRTREKDEKFQFSFKRVSSDGLTEPDKTIAYEEIKRVKHKGEMAEFVRELEGEGERIRSEELETKATILVQRVKVSFPAQPEFNLTVDLAEYTDPRIDSAQLFHAVAFLVKRQQTQQTWEEETSRQITLLPSHSKIVRFIELTDSGLFDFLKQKKFILSEKTASISYASCFSELHSRHVVRPEDKDEDEK